MVIHGMLAPKADSGMTSFDNCAKLIPIDRLMAS